MPHSVHSLAHEDYTKVPNNGNVVVGILVGIPSRPTNFLWG